MRHYDKKSNRVENGSAAAARGTQSVQFCSQAGGSDAPKTTQSQSLPGADIDLIRHAADLGGRGHRAHAETLLGRGADNHSIARKSDFSRLQWLCQQGICGHVSDTRRQHRDISNKH